MHGFSLHAEAGRTHVRLVAPETLQVEIEEAARVDGAKPWQSFWRVLLPMALPILVVVFMLAFIGAIIEYPVASVLLTQQDQLTLAVGSKLFVHEHDFH